MLDKTIKAIKEESETYGPPAIGPETIKASISKIAKAVEEDVKDIAKNIYRKVENK